MTIGIPTTAPIYLAELLCTNVEALCRLKGRDVFFRSYVHTGLRTSAT